jgi:hypothetical protein
MRRNLGYVLAVGALLIAACSDNQLAPGGTGPSMEPTRPGRPAFLVELPAQCATPAQAQRAIDEILPQLFVIGDGRWLKAIAFNLKIRLARHYGNTALVKSTVEAFINFTLEAYYAGNVTGGQSPETQARVLQLIYLLYCSNSITPIPDLSGIFDAQNTVLVTNTTPTTVVSDPLDSAAVKVEQGDVPPTVFGTFISVQRTDRPLPTSLDWYGVDGYKLGAFEFVANPPVDFEEPVLAGVCVTFDNAIVSSNDLRLAHAVQPGDTPAAPGNTIVTTAGGTIEIGAYADPSPLGLACDPLPPPPSVSGSILGRLLQQLAQLVVPVRAYAGAAGGSTGGTVRKFSPFAAVDIKLNGTGTGPSSPQYIPVGSTATSAPVSVTVTTSQGVPVAGLPVSFAPGASFTPTPATADEGGTAHSTWTLVEGANAATATPPQPLTFTSAVEFSATAVQLTPLLITAPTSPLTDGLKDTPYPSTTFIASGGTGGGYAFTVVGGAVPAGLGLSNAGVLSGTPTASGSFTFTVQVTSGPLTATRAYTLNVAAPVTITTTSPLPYAKKGRSYSKTLQATGGSGTYTWSVTSGALPSGLTLSTGGVVSGKPTSTGTFTFTVRALSGTASATKAFSLTVKRDDDD